ncbi:MAG TPA: SPOR domain-containing protein [Usitatibacter sp.]|nr:SPOR domain-containing protein [Usitatibacter sp.]
MPKDYKDAPASRGESRLSHPMLLGMIIGLLMGVVISLAVALWLNRLSNPFMEKGRAVEPVSKMAPAQPAPPPDAAKKAEQASAKAAAPEKKAGERPRFEFYQILPGEKEVTEKEAKAAPTSKAGPQPPPAATASAKPGSSPATPKPHSGEVYWLQAGAFSEEREADNLKARIALTGLEATVKPVSIPEKGTLYRVRLGPYQSLDDANRFKVTLSQNGVGAAIIRTTDEARKP